MQRNLKLKGSLSQANLKYSETSEAFLFRQYEGGTKAECSKKNSVKKQTTVSAFVTKAAKREKRTAAYISLCPQDGELNYQAAFKITFKL